MTVFSDRFRLRKAAACVAVMVLLGLQYGRAVMGNDRGWRACLASPASHDGDEVIFTTYTVTHIDGPDRFEISGVVSGVPVEGDASGIALGDRVSVKGHFRASDRVVVSARQQVHTLWPWKVGLGLLGLAAAVLAAPLGFTIRDGRVVERG